MNILYNISGSCISGRIVRALLNYNNICIDMEKVKNYNDIDVFMIIIFFSPKTLLQVWFQLTVIPTPWQVWQLGPLTYTTDHGREMVMEYYCVNRKRYICILYIIHYRIPIRFISRPVFRYGIYDVYLGNGYNSVGGGLKISCTLREHKG